MSELVTPKEQTKEFYDRFGAKLLKDFALGNDRLIAAIEKALKWIPSDTNRLLDIGCGIGWSSYEFSCKATEVVGVDLSDKLLRIGGSVFGSQNDNISFQNVDITSANFLENERFDFVTMIDVYEHIELGARESFHQCLKSLLVDGGGVFLSCPTIRHQEYLRTKKPDGLQPVDEDVTLEDISKIADDIGGFVVHFEIKSIWNRGDYFHAILQKGDVLKEDIFREAYFGGVIRPNLRKKYIKQSDYAELVDAELLRKTAEDFIPPYIRRLVRRLM